MAAHMFDFKTKAVNSHFLLVAAFLCVEAGKLSISMRWMIAGGSSQNGTLIAVE